MMSYIQYTLVQRLDLFLRRGFAAGLDMLFIAFVLSGLRALLHYLDVAIPSISLVQGLVNDSVVMQRYWFSVYLLTGFPFLELLALRYLYVVTFLYYMGATPGMYFSEICLWINADELCKFKVLTIRYFASILSYGLLLGCLWTLVDRRGRAWHDILVGVQIRERKDWPDHQHR